MCKPIIKIVLIWLAVTISIPLTELAIANIIIESNMHGDEGCKLIEIPVMVDDKPAIAYKEDPNCIKHAQEIQ